MRIDSQLQFVAPGAPLSVVGANTSFASTVVDLSGFGSGNAITNIIGTPTSWGTDFGVGRFKPELEIVMGTAFTTGTSATLNAAFQLAPDSGSNTPGTYVTAIETGPIVAANLTANTLFARFAFPLAFPVNLNPRFARILFSVVNTSTAGTIAYAILTAMRDDMSQKFAAKNYAVV